VAVAVSGDRSLLTGRVSAELPALWALRLHDPTDLALAGLTARNRPAHQPPGRVVSTRDGTVAQVLAPAQDRSGRASLTHLGEPPPQVLTLPTRYAAGDGWAVGGDSAQPVPRPAGSVLVLGPHRSGVTTTLRQLMQSGPRGPTARSDPATVLVVGPTDLPEDLTGRLASPGVGTIVVDDVHLLAGTTAEDLVLEWSRRTGGRLLVGGELDACATLYRGLVPHVARAGTGVVLRPSSAQHGVPFGARLPLGDLRVPGRGVLVERGACTRVQVAGP
jgi:S-DNA-T family DNA segregation ATPase FtsK/SpoIIIE